MAKSRGRLCAGRFCMAASLVAIAFAGCGPNNSLVWVYIDNAGNQPMAVTVDGQEAATIEPGEATLVKYPPGDHHFLIRSGDETVCDLVRTLEPSDRFGMARKYLFDPLKRNRYQIYEVKYGSSRLDGVMESSLLKFQKDPAIRQQYVYKQLLKEIQILPDDAWNDVTSVNYILTEPPQIEYGRTTVRRSVLDRIEIRYCDLLDQMARIEQPSEVDIDSLDELIGEILSQ
jgi:hypothetical protein